MSVDTLSISSVSDDDNGIAESQTPAGAGDLSLDGALVTDGIATFGAAQIVTIESAADETGRTFTVTGTYGNRTQTEAITGANAGSADSTKYFSTVTSISVDAATTGAVFAGVVLANGAATEIHRMNLRSRDFKAGLFGKLSSGASLTWKVQATPDDISDSDAVLTWYDHSALTSQTANAAGNYEFRSVGSRAVLTAYTSGSFDMIYVED